MMCKLILFVFAACGLVKVSVGQIVQNGQCDPNIQLAEDFDINLFSGIWYEVYRTQNPYQSGECAYFEFNINNNNNIEVSHFGVNRNWLEESIGTATLPARTAKLTLDISMFYVRLREKQNTLFEVNSLSELQDQLLSVSTEEKNGKFFIDDGTKQEKAKDFWVLMTNYNNFAVTYSCENISSSLRRIYLWVLGRDKHFNEMIPGLITTQLNNLLGISLNDLTTIDHSHMACYVLPVIEPGEPVVLPGQCDPHIPVVENFKVAEFTGVWNLISRYHSETMAGTCLRTQFTLDSGVINILNSQVFVQALLTTSGTATPMADEKTAKFKVVLYTYENIQYDLWILATDYDSYALAYSCINVGSDQQRIYSWIMSRTRELTKESETELNRVIDSILVLNQDFYMPVDQSSKGCFYYPEVTGEPVIFPGQCERQEINVVKNFNANAYLGLWHTIELYPSEPQSGTCSNAFYTINDDNVINILNSDVRDQSLIAVSATATVAEDGSGKLKVTFPSTPGSVDYWVLGTDYATYALAYSCSNVDHETMRVSVWKLSRSKSLSSAAEIAIAVLMSNSNILDQRYFIDMDQTATACFYYPVPQPGIPVVFPGECDPLIGMSDFDLSKFEGTWYEVESYATMREVGHCIRHENTYADNQIQVTSKSISNRVLGITNSTLTARDTSGRLTMTISLDDEDHEDIPFWIIDTDYNDYALAYTCLNVVFNENPEFRTVWSWKLSRTKQQSDHAKAAFNKAIANIDVLENKYYESIDHSDSACFYLPDIELGNPIILPGQCNSNITGMAGFDINRFTGTWHEIGSYYIENSTGSCVRAEYAQEDNLITVIYSHVDNEGLYSVSGTVIADTEDNRGYLKIILNVSNQKVKKDLWILDTDYENYAVSYSCQNVNNEQQRVYSSIFSRTRNLSAESQAEVDRLVDAFPVLHKPYYIYTDQSASGCFFYPKVTDSPVIFRGQCEDHQIDTVKNFDAAAFMGLWHTIELYPSAPQRGSCSNAFYKLSENGVINVLNSDVREQSLYTVTASAVAASDDGSGKLKISFPVPDSNATIDMDYWILGTDYKSYALVYSCINMDDDNMRVTSWKLSRNKILDVESENAIVFIMNDIKLLDQKYYQMMDQSPTGCFYYPAPEPGFPVVFPGECDPDIAMKDFSLPLFEGTWYEIEKFPKTERSGECIENVYKNVSEHKLALTSSNVYNELLFKTNGKLRATDDSGRLTLSIDSASGSDFIIPFWIVATDYNDYALVYSCDKTSVNDNPDYRAVRSWKLSRTRQQTSNGATAINNAMQAIDVLDKRYYEVIDQSAEACFHLPEIAKGQPIILPGQCDNSIKGIENFNLNAFSGRWRLIESYPSDNQIGTCNVARYNTRNDNTLAIEHSEVREQSLSIITGIATLPNTDGRLEVTFSAGESIRSMEYIILDTDYTSYALAYSCANVDSDRRRVWSWKLSRQKTLSLTAIENINNAVAGINVLHNPYYYNISHDDADCFYFPIANPNTEVGFRGQCDPNFPVVKELNIEKFMGLWHDIKSYPIQIQIGSCPNTYFSLFEKTITIYNTQVIDQSLSKAIGLSQLEHHDGSGRLTITFNVNGQYVTSNYWVLATDYHEYALLYSCENYDDEFMTVYSWQLSRSKTLSDESNEAISDVLKEHDVLDNRYYVKRDQSAAGCFYFPDSKDDTPVIFPGQCDRNITAVPHFDVSQFSGVWHEIASYFYLDSGGQCVSHEFTVATTSIMTMQSSSVFNQTLYSSSSPVNLDTDDGSGKFTVDIVVDGQIQTIPFWILATDYTDYALAYSCVNLHNDRRQIYSWKLSRTRLPTPTGLAAINTAMLSIDVLDDMYFGEIHQNNEACFYLPDISLGEPVTFFGQCDPNIAAVSNFDVSKYLGRWRLIETYYSEFQSGSCSEANYDQQRELSFEVVNSHVVDQQLLSITGTATAASDGSGKLTVTLPSSNTPSELWILDTDYESYSLVYSCENISKERRRVWSWKMSRTNTLTDTANIAINRIVAEIDVLNPRYYRTVDRSEEACLYYPIPDANVPVIFRGQCDTNITAFPNFEPARFQGLWYDIESYPAPFQSGTCPTSTYTIKDGVMYLVNSHIENQLMLSWDGIVTVTSHDGSAELSVKLTVNEEDVVTKLWILDTDYESYALAYSCTNLDPETRAVTSWKMSRTPTLSPNANIAINAIINNIVVLEQKYFVERSHSEQDCFYYPNNYGGNVILPGQCLPSESVLVVPDLNMDKFAGTWYEISRFPSESQSGTCVTIHSSGTDTDIYSVTHNVVINETLNTLKTEVKINKNGKGIIFVNTNEGLLTKIYVLATNYDDFALLQACHNINEKQKQIYSWILSRTRAGISTVAQATISEVVSKNIDLWEGYYTSTEQDKDACFYYPVFDTMPVNIIMPVPCLPNIRGIPNFNSAKYLGKWYEVGRYPTSDHKGQCNRGEYSESILDESRTYFSYTEVVEQVLESQLSIATQTDKTRGEYYLEIHVNGELRKYDYYVLATDYISYALVYSCTNLPDETSVIRAWKRSRTPTLSPEAADAIDYVIANTRGITQEYFQVTSQSESDCFYIPRLNPQLAPRFRGQCENITGVEDFNMNKYLGWWHEIRRYPIDGSAGECRSTEYILEDSTYRLTDTFIQNNNGITDTGTVVVFQNGKLLRTIAGRGTEEIWVLATDYKNYSLLYSCVNIDSDYKRVWSAIHSKKRIPISAEAEAAIAPFIVNYNVLVEQFYFPVDQSDEVCFHYPSIIYDDIIIPGQCDLNIPIVTNFNINAFLGDWYHIERYDEVGISACIGTRLSMKEEGGVIDVLNYEVRDNTLFTEEGTARLITDDGKGIFELIFPIPYTKGNTVSTIVSVLATDYTDFALIFSCTNVNKYQRRVRAWKLSRHRSLSSAGHTAIATLIRQRQELHQPYFKRVEQDINCLKPNSALIIKNSVIFLILSTFLLRIL